MSTPKQILTTAVDILEDPKHTHITGVTSLYSDPKTGQEEDVSTMDPKANCFCTLGAIYRAAGIDQKWSAPYLDHPAITLLANVIREETGRDFGDSDVEVVFTFNDINRRGLSCVRDLMRKAAA